MSLRKASAQTLANKTVGAAMATTNNIRTLGGGGAGGGVSISSINITNSSYNNLTQTAANTIDSSVYITINGSGFQNGCNVFVMNGATANGANATAVSFVNSTQLNVQLPGASPGVNANVTYIIYATNPDRSGAIFATGLKYSQFPYWSSSSGFAAANTYTTFYLSASSDSTITYALAPGSNLPAGTTLAANGLITANVTTANTYTFNVIATDSEVQANNSTFTLNVTVATDPYFLNTTLLLNGETATPHWLEDQGPNDVVTTITGNTAPIGFSPYNMNWSDYFDGSSSNYISTPSISTTFAGDFTIEAWVYLASTATNRAIISMGTGTIWEFSYSQSTNKLQFIVSPSTVIAASTASMKLNTWHHCAVVRSGTSVTVYLDGTAGTPATYTTTVSNTAAWNIGALNSTTDLMNGYISNLRVTNTAVYISGFTPPTSPLSAIAGTQLLTAQTNRWSDSSSNAYTLTRNGNAVVKSFGPFTETDLTTGSAYFDGVGDYLLASNSAFTLGTADCTIEAWIYPLARSGSDFDSIIDVEDSGSNNGLGLFLNGTSGVLSINDGPAANVTQSTSTAPLSTWSHVALSRSGTLITAYLNGANVATRSTSSSVNSTTCYIGTARGTPGGARSFIGYISNVRIVKGSAVYTSAFTPPSSTLAAVTNTSYLTLQYRNSENNNRVIDSSGQNNNMIRYGDATVGTFSPFSQQGWAFSMVGTNDNVVLPSTTALNIEAVDFTIEAWVWLNAMPTGTSTTSWSADFNNWFVVYERSAGGTTGWQFRIGATLLTFGGTGDSSIAWGTHGMTTNTWYHIALSGSWNGTYNTGKMFVNGSQLSLTTQSTAMATSGNYYIGSEDTSGANFNGYISNLRVLKGQQLYTSSFTPPTAPLQATANTVLLTCNSGTLIDKSTSNNVITKSGTTSKIVAFSPFASRTQYLAANNGASIYLDGAGDYVQGNTFISTLAANTSDFTIDFWVYPIASSRQDWFDLGATSGTNRILVYYTGTAITYLAGDVQAGTARITGTIAAANIQNQWSHIAVSRVSNVSKLFLNGNQLSTSNNDNLNFTSALRPTIGKDPGGGTYVTGYIAHPRYVIGQGIYTSTFVPPTNPPAPVPGTAVLLNFTEGGIIDASSRSNFETFGNVKTTNVVSKYGSKSLAFNGSTDYITAIDNPLHQLLAQAFAIEGWVYVNAIGVAYGIISKGTATTGWSVNITATNKIQFSYTATALTGATSITTNTWYHFAVVRNGSGTGNLKIYLNGTVDATSAGAVTDNFNQTNTLYVGADRVAASILNGYLDDIRITKGIPRYTTNFAIPGVAPTY